MREGRLQHLEHMAVPSLSSSGINGSALSGSSGPPKKKEPEIVVIPEKFYGVALKLNPASPPAEQKAPPPPKPVPQPVTKPSNAILKEPANHSRLILVLALLFTVLLIGGGFVYLNRDALFKKSAPALVTPVLQVPASPTDLAATSSGNAIAVNWTDVATNETGYRLERKEANGPFSSLTTLPADTNAFLDVSVQAGQTYVYRVIAVNVGGESTLSNEAQVSTAPSIPTLVQPSLPPGGLDPDSDGLSDLEEPIYGTDLHNPDTDGDGFLDGNEVYHLYNPAAKAPVRLLDSGLVRLFSWLVDKMMYCCH